MPLLSPVPQKGRDPKLPSACQFRTTANQSEVWFRTCAALHFLDQLCEIRHLAYCILFRLAWSFELHIIASSGLRGCCRLLSHGWAPWDFCMLTLKSFLLVSLSDFNPQCPWNRTGMARRQEKGRPGARMGYRGIQLDLTRHQSVTFADLWFCQQLLANWRRARGKERDALLWGDEVYLRPHNALSPWSLTPRCMI